MKYKLTLKTTTYEKVGGEYKDVEVKRSGICYTWDDVNNFLGYYTEIFGRADITIEAVEEEEK